MPLIIVESPTKANTISKFLGPNYKVLSSYGHIRDLPKSSFGIDIENNFKPKYIIPLKAKKRVNSLKKEAEKTGLIILATDEDREGEAIAWHLSQVLNLKKFQGQGTNLKNLKHNNKEKSYQRIVFHEITKKAIEKALKNPRQIDLNLVNAQQARRILDRIVGYKLSPFLWKKIARGLSAGRVQSVALRIIVEREREIENFIPEEYWLIEGKFQKKSGKDEDSFSAFLTKINGKKIPKPGIKKKEEAEKILENLKKAKYRILKIEKKEIKKNPLPPFTTSTLQQAAWQKFHWPAKMTMNIAQQLYETGKITYHRTDSLNLSQESLISAKKIIENNFGNHWPGFFRTFKTKSKSAQEAHEAIRPAHPEETPEKIKLEKNQLKLYQLIWQRFIASQMKEAIFDSTKMEIIAEIKENQEKNFPQYIFQANGKTLKFDGFLKVYPLKSKENELPLLEKNDELEAIKITSSQHFTKPPSRYNEASLIKVLEENGIGRPSTYAPILSTIQERNYVQKDEQKRFFPTEIGVIVNDILVKHFPAIIDIKFTAKMEKDLDEIAKGKKDWTKVCQEFYLPFAENLKKKYEEVSKKEFIDQTIDKKCPKCGAPLVIKLGKFGKFYACSNFPKCKYTEPIEKNNLHIQCPKCGEGEIIEKRTKKGKIFYACNKFPKCNFALWDKPSGEICPKCGSLLVEKNKQVKCSNKNCDFKKNMAK